MKEALIYSQNSDRPKTIIKFDKIISNPNGADEFYLNGALVGKVNPLVFCYVIQEIDTQPKQKELIVIPTTKESDRGTRY